jgi:hypothetical protein
MAPAPKSSRPDEIPTTAMSALDANAVDGPAGDDLPTAADDAAEPQRLGDFRLLRRLGSGGICGSG